MARRPGILLLTLLVAVAAVVAVERRGDGGSSAQAALLPQPPDSDAPRGAPPHWIPSEEWVMQHWLPYDESRLAELLRVSRAAVWRHLRDDRSTLGGLAARRGWPDPRRLAAALVRPRLDEVPENMRAELEERALRTLTQGHMSQHMLFHSLHQDAVPDRAREVFGVRSVDGFQRLRRLDISPLQIARMNGLSRAHVQTTAERALRERATAGVRGGDMSRRQADLLVARQLRQLPRWLAEAHYNGPPRTDANGRVAEPPKPAWAAPVLSADGGTVVLEAYEPKLPLALQRGEISVMAVAGGRAEPVSHARASSLHRPYSAYNPAVSADGRHVAFETSAGNRNFAKRYGDLAVYVADRDTGRVERVSRGGTAYAPAISADGSVVTYQVTGREGHGTSVEVASRTAGGWSYRTAGAGYEPTVSGDGRLVAFTSLARDGSEILVFDRRRGRGRTVARAADAWSPRLSGDGRRLVYAASGPEGGASRIHVRDLGTGHEQVVGRERPGFATEPAIAADGSAVAFALAVSASPDRSRRRPRQSVYVAELDGSTARRVSRGRYSATPSLSADGSRVAFAAEVDGVLRIHSQAVDSAEPSPPLELPTSFAAPARRARAGLCRLAPPAW